MKRKEKKANKDDLMVFHPNMIQSMDRSIVDNLSNLVSILHKL